MNNPLIINIQKCSIHDGEGIRSTVFFKGCPLECSWCHNPESQSYNKEILHNSEKCSKCSKCISKCMSNAIDLKNDKILFNKSKCIGCGLCSEYCINGANDLVGKEYSIKELIKELKKDMLFYEQSGGGITLSGGEVMTQNIDYLLKVCKSCKDLGINVAIDTCGHANFEQFEKIFPYVDTFLYDIKLINREKHKIFTGKYNDLILDNLTRLSEKKANINIRIPLIEGVNVGSDNEEINQIINFLIKLNIKKVNLLPYHDIAMHKYEKMNKDYTGISFKKPSEEKLEEIKTLFINHNFNTKIGG